MGAVANREAFGVEGSRLASAKLLRSGTEVPRGDQSRPPRLIGVKIPHDVSSATEQASA